MRRILSSLLRLFRPLYRPVVPWLLRRLAPDLGYARLSFSQEGEDLLLNSLFQAGPPVARFYVDIGAHHPRHYSNTYYFYRNGWQGINIDAMPGSMEEFERERPRDINVAAAVAQEPQTLVYHMYAQPGLNTFSEELVRDRIRDLALHPADTCLLRTRTLSDVLDAELPPGQQIGFLNVDVEGLDLQVLKSLDFARYLPQYILVEDSTATSGKGTRRSDIAVFLSGKGYYPVARAFRTGIFRTDMHEQAQDPHGAAPHEAATPDDVTA